MNCKVCGKVTKKIFAKKVLGKYNVDYFKCPSCGFMQTDKPYWLKEAYSHAISLLDVGLVSRNIHLSNLTEKIIKKAFNIHSKFIDFGGGYGLFVRIMRDKGFNFYRQDVYCDNLFAEFFDVSDLKEEDRKFELLTAFELFEHLEDPRKGVEEMLNYSSSILFSTELEPSEKIDSWWYLSPETGQHISFYTPESLKILGKSFNLSFYSNGSTVHLLSRKKLDFNPFSKQNFVDKVLAKTGLEKDIKLESLTWKDHEYIKKLLQK